MKRVLSQYAVERYPVIISLVAMVATTGSLYFSNVMGLYPCTFCWYQRILMYPLVIIGAYSAITGKQLHGLIGIMSGSGLLISAYHSLIQRVGSGACGTVCPQIQYEFLGVLSIPNLALIAFTLIFGSTIISIYTDFL